ncbi:hypothetical protein GR183_13185 [Stappia sp. GBMRC 2046]|uniref:Tetratricopeptide repeat-containing protein n=1 Tax=Stappia sediminis TaxID=2692190 RepID=A0A7X3LVF7_9HYPH|nr:tetratricopeptide repeat protein [Stappia sediminis]MXN65861.1 hypothetical protein [Stappia sediminis]
MDGISASVISVVIIAFACMISAPADAQVFDPLEYAEEDLVARQARLLQKMLREPDNMQLAFEYATVSVELEDFEAAIGTFERMLVFAPDLAQVRLELGVLYFRLGSFDTARVHLEVVREEAAANSELGDKASTYLEAIEKAEEPAKFGGAIVVGGRYQTNANAGPGDSLLNLNGFPVLLNQDASGTPDWNAFISGGVHGSLDLGNQGDLFETDLLFYGSRYADIHRLDNELAELNFGPTFNMARFDLYNARLGVYGIVGGARLDNENYYGQLGGGAKFEYLPDIKSSLNARAEIRRRWFYDSFNYPTVSDRDGYQMLGKLTYFYQLTEMLQLRAQVMGDYESAEVGYEESWELGVVAGGTVTFASPINTLNYPWAFDLEAGYIRREYADPDNFNSFTQAERDNEFWLRGVLTLLVREDVAFAFTSEFHRLQSNYETRQYSNGLGMVSVVKTF